MKQSEAIQYLRNAMFLVQKMRSNAESDLVAGSVDPPGTRKVIATIQKWLFDNDFTLVNPLEKLLNQVDQGGPLPGMDFYNIMFIIDRFVPELNATTPLFKMDPFPEPSINWITGWDSE